MSLAIRPIVVAVLYTALLSWIHLNEIVVFWSYMGFYGEFTPTRFVAVLVAAAVLAVITPQPKDTRGYILVTMQFLFFIPSIVYIGFSEINWDHVVSFFILIAFVYSFSALRIGVPDIGAVSPKLILSFVFGAILFALLIQATFGGLEYFNLDIERVYEFRRVAAAELPPIFGYVYSNVSSALVPLSLLLSMKYRSRALIVLTLVSAVLLFGMTHHKTVLFGPFILLVLYKLFERQYSSKNIMNLVFLAIPIIGLMEIYFTRSILGQFSPGYLNSLIIRRVLMVPTMLDSLYIDYFGQRSFYYWSWSRIGGLFVSNPYDQAAPFVIGFEYFSDLDMSANAGVIASGYANAGLVGVALYSMLAGLLLALLNAYGRRIGHAFVAAASLMTFHTILTTADLLTAILSHGVLLLLMVLTLFPSAAPQPVARPQLQPA
jgi:hypothetical protein